MVEKKNFEGKTIDSIVETNKDAEIRATKLAEYCRQLDAKIDAYRETMHLQNEFVTDVLKQNAYYAEYINNQDKKITELRKTIEEGYKTLAELTRLVERQKTVADEVIRTFNLKEGKEKN